MQGPGDPRSRYPYNAAPIAAPPHGAPHMQNGGGERFGETRVMQRSSAPGAYGTPPPNGYYAGAAPTGPQQAYIPPPPQPFVAPGPRAGAAQPSMTPMHASMVAPAAPIAARAPISAWPSAAGAANLNPMKSALGVLDAPKPKRALPASLAFVFPLVGVAVALLFDVIFLKIHIPGVGGYAWYLTTAFSFAVGGYTAAGYTRASRGLAMTAVVIGAIVYGLLDVGLSMALEGVTVADGLILGAKGLVIALITGGGGVQKAVRSKGD